MSKPIFIRDEKGKIIQVIRHTPQKKQGTRRPVGFNASKDGFVTAPPIKPVVPTPSAVGLSNASSLEVDPNLSFEELEKRKKQFEVIKKLNADRQAEALLAYINYKDIAKQYGNAITFSEGEPLNPEAAKLGPLVRESYLNMVKYRLDNEDVNTLMQRLAYDNYIKDNQERKETYKIARANCLAEFKVSTERLDSLENGDEGSETQKVYLEAQEARESCRKHLFTLQYSNASADLDFALNEFMLLSDSVISELGEGNEVDEGELEEIRSTLWDANRQYELATFELLTYRGSETESMEDIEKSHTEHKERILTVLEYNYDLLDKHLMRMSTHSEQSESEETYQVSLAYDVAKKEFKSYREEAKSVYTKKERTTHQGHSIDDSHRSDCRLCGGKG